jgi:signal transduction histidine kinase
MMREDFDLNQALEDLIKTFRDRTQLNVVFERSGTPEKLTADVQLTLFRVLQESLSNCAKHAGANRVQVQLRYADGQVHLAVRDDGKGFDPSRTPGGHYGLLNMRERAAKTGGQIVIDSTAGAGTQISFSVPTNP